jgi:hypothetical protein
MNLNGLKAERFLQAEVGAVFYSTKSGWFSYEDVYGNFGVFTRFVIYGLKGQADNSKISGNEDGIITFSELSSYVEESVSNWALNEGKRQRPYTKILGEKFGDLALSAYVKTGDHEKKDEEIKELEISEDKPAGVTAVETMGIPVNKNETGILKIIIRMPPGKIPQVPRVVPDACYAAVVGRPMAATFVVLYASRSCLPIVASIWASASAKKIGE